MQLWRPGQRVYGITGGGAHAEYLVAHERAVAEVPAGVEWADAGTIPEAFITAHDALVAQASAAGTGGWYEGAASRVVDAVRADETDDRCLVLVWRD